MMTLFLLCSCWRWLRGGAASPSSRSWTGCLLLPQTRRISRRGATSRPLRLAPTRAGACTLTRPCPRIRSRARDKRSRTAAAAEPLRARTTAGGRPCRSGPGETVSRRSACGRACAGCVEPQCSNRPRGRTLSVCGGVCRGWGVHIYTPLFSWVFEIIIL